MRPSVSAPALHQFGIASRTAIALIVCAAAVLGAAGVIGARTRNALERRLLEERAHLVADVVARAIAEAMDGDRPHQVEAVLEAVARSEGLSGLAVAFPSDEVTFARGTVPARLPSGDERPRWTGDGLSLTRALAVTDQCAECHEGASTGTLFVGLDLGPEIARDRAFALTLAVGLAAAVFAVAGVIVLVVRHWVTAPLRRLEFFARRLSDGDLTARPPDEEWPETRELALALRTMADRLQQSHEGLTRRVEERTVRMVNAERLASLGQMSAQLAHELRNPLNAVGGAVQYLRRVFAREKAMTEYGALIEEELARMNRFVDDLLRVARPSAPVLGEVDVNDLARAAVRTTLLGRGMGPDAVRVTVEAELPHVQLDRRMVLEALMNLLENALEAGGTEPVELEVQTDATGGERSLVFAVLDRGAGISPSVESRLGRPFATSKPAGTGLGLVIVNHAAQQHGGSFRLVAREGGGAAATLRVPLRTAARLEEKAA